MIGSIAGVVDLVCIVVIGEADSDRLVDTDEVTEEVPAPRVFSGPEGALLAFDEDGTNFVEATKLTGCSRASLQPNDEGDRLIFPRQVIESLPEGIVHGGGSLGIVPIDILIATVGLESDLMSYLIGEELGCVGECGVGWDDADGDKSHKGQAKQIFHQLLYPQALIYQISLPIPPLFERLASQRFLQQNNKYMSQNPKFSFQRNSFAQNRFDQASNLHESSIREQSIKNLTFRSNTKDNHEDALKFISTYKPIDESFPVATLEKSPNFTLKVYKESNYYGELVNNKKHGWGVMLYKNQKIYEGQWENDKKKGFGVQQFPNGCFYKGHYQNGKPQGEGFYKWSNGQTYDGEWRKGERHGVGTWKAANGDQYEGEWREGKPNGSGFASSNGDTYEGQFKQSFKNGFGVQKFANGDQYRGHYVNGMPSGQGTYYWADKSYFKGNFINGLREGKGIWKKGAGNCDKYEGYYKNDKKWGYGEFIWASGNVYKGNYEGDVRSGYGEMFWTNGSYYKGQWVNGVQHGEGQIYVPQEGYRRAVFSNNSIAQIIEERLISKQLPNRTRGRSQATSKEEELAKSKNFKSFRSKHKQQNPMKNILENKIQHKQQRTQSIEWAKQKSASVKPQTPFQRSERRVRILKQNQKQKSIETDDTKQKIGIFYKQFPKGHQFQSLNVSKSKQREIKADINWKKSKQRILHSSFYLYKLNHRHRQELGSTNRSSPRYVNNFVQN